MAFLAEEIVRRAVGEQPDDPTALLAGSVDRRACHDPGGLACQQPGHAAASVGVNPNDRDPIPPQALAEQVPRASTLVIRGHYYDLCPPFNLGELRNLARLTSRRLWSGFDAHRVDTACETKLFAVVGGRGRKDERNTRALGQRKPRCCACLACTAQDYYSISVLDVVIPGEQVESEAEQSKDKDGSNNKRKRFGAREQLPCLPLPAPDGLYRSGLDLPY